MRSTKIADSIQHDCEEIVSDLTNYDAKFKNQLARIKIFKEEKENAKDTYIRNEMEQLVQELEKIRKSEELMLREMAFVKGLYAQMKKYQRLEMDVPGEIMNNLVEKILQIKTTKAKDSRKEQEIIEDFDDLLQNSNRKPLSKAGNSLLDSTVMTIKKPNHMKDTSLSSSLNFDNIALVKQSQDSKQFSNYLKSYEDELSKSLLVFPPGTSDYMSKLHELGKVSELRAVFNSQAAKPQDAGPFSQKSRAPQMPSQNPTGPPSLKNPQTTSSLNLSSAQTEEIALLQNRLAQMTTTVSSLETLLMEKERFSSLQRLKYAELEKERNKVEIEQLRAEREHMESENLKRLQRINMEMEYIEQIKTKALNAVTSQMDKWGKNMVERAEARRTRELEFEKQRMLDLQNEFILRERKRQAEFDSHILALEERLMMQEKREKEMRENGAKNDPNGLKGRDIWKELGTAPADWEEEFGKRDFENGVKRIIHEFGGKGDDGEMAKMRRIVIYNTESEEDDEGVTVTSKKAKTFKSKTSRASKRQSIRSMISKKSKSSRRSTSRALSIPVFANDNDSDLESIFFRVEQMKNLPENFTYTMIEFAIIDENGATVSNVGEMFAIPSSDSMNPVLQQNIKIPIKNIKDDYIYLYGEVRTVDDGIPGFPSTVYGCIICKLTGEEKEAAEIPIFFDSYSEELIHDYEKNFLEIHSGSSMQITVSKGGILRSKEYDRHEEINTDYQYEVQRDLAKRSPEPMLEKMRFAIQNHQDHVDEELTDEEIMDKMRELLLADDKEFLWTSAKYLLPLKKDFRWISIYLEGIICTDTNVLKDNQKSVYFAKMFINPSKKKAKRDFFYITKIDWTTSPLYQVFEDEPPFPGEKSTKERQFELDSLGTKNAVIIIIYKTSIIGTKVNTEQVGFSFMPLLSDTNHPIVGINVVPFIKSVLDEQTLEYFSGQDSWELLDSISSGEEIEPSNLYTVIKITDQYRQV